VDRGGSLSRWSWAAYDERRSIELVMLVSHYQTLATALYTRRLSPDRSR